MSGTSKRIRVLVIEHNQILLEGLCQLLSELPDMDLAGVANSSLAGLALFEQKRPTVTIIDLDLPDATAATLVQRIRQIEKTAPILILTAYELGPAAIKAVAAGASAVIAKNQIAAMLAPLIRSVSRSTP